MIIFFEILFLFLTKYTLFAEKNVLYGKKFYNENFFLEKTFFYGEKYKWKYTEYISYQKYSFTQKMCVLQIKYKSFLNIYSFSNSFFCELNNNWVLRVSKAANMWYSLH